MHRTNFKPVKILIIEDNDDHWLLMERAIQQCFFNVVVVRVDSAIKALTLLEESLRQEWDMPRLILLDLYLPTREDGLMFLRCVKQMPLACQQIPVALLSASAARADLIEAYQAGIASYCLKPITVEGWTALFKSLGAYWLGTVALPQPYHSLSTQSR